MSWRGHLYTLVPRLAAELAPTRSAARPWSTVLADPVIGAVRLGGALETSGDGTRLAILVHGLGGSAASPYQRHPAAALVDDGWSVLRVDLRGADRRGEDFYHAGLTADLHATLAAPDLAGYRDVVLVGFSLGGHVVLRAASESLDPRVRAVAALCAPLDLAATADAFDAQPFWPYRAHVMRGLVEMYAAAAARRPVPEPLAAARRIRSVREWDERIVAPRHGFAGADDYYTRASVAARLGRIAIPALLLVGEEDPMVPPATYGDCLDRAPPHLEVRRVAAAGHLGFPRRLRFGEEAPPGVARQLAGWLRRRTAASAACDCAPALRYSRESP